MTLIKFGNEVLSKGPAGVLPQHLSQEWLTRLQQMADDFLDQYFAFPDNSSLEEMVHQVLSACISEILHFQENGGARTSEEYFFRKVSLYCLEITIESERRTKGIAIDPPSLEDILTTRRLEFLKSQYPPLVPLLDEMGIG